MKKNKQELKSYFETGDKPTQEQYSDLIDSYIDAKQSEGEPNRRFVIDETGEVLLSPEYETSILKIEKEFFIEDLQKEAVYEILPAQGENTLLTVHKAIIDVEINTPYEGVTTSPIFEIDSNGEYFIGTSAFLNINELGRKIAIRRPSGGEFTTSILNKPIRMIPKLTGINGTLIAKVIVFYSKTEI